MSLLDFANQSKSPRSAKPFKVILGAGALAAVIGLGSTFAANIRLNTGAPIEFGQGVAQTTACDSNVILTPISTFVNADGGGEFKFTAITLVGLDTTEQSEISPDGCAGKILTIKAYDDNGVLLNPSYTISVGVSAFTSEDGTTPGSNFGEESSVTLTFDTAVIASTDVYRVTIESGLSEATVPPIVYAVGETGPGGGTIFYVDDSVEGFDETGAPCSPNCHYLEAAPTNPAVLDYWTDDSYQWSGNISDGVGTTSEGFSSGWENTWQLINQPNGGTALAKAGTIAHAYRGPNGLTDWFLPSRHELNTMCKWQGGLAWVSNEEPCTSPVNNSGPGAAGFMDDGYWSSSEFDATSAMGQSFYNASQSDVIKAVPMRVRPIRAF
ncbi:MAG: hypothetical protein F2690_05615 [Actinobacteria bacterium]|uniref:Unannotated protein n=1 Tax=freshwater metagenome TaxID=449393 RepID=A0A6J6SJB1_9ZZZZ|nr:hypothetical protein [Actinomycetota bacterium]MSX72356.1 hypothetical protein [Actinomycetota bacterium]MSY70024.1 hypothetical protein [Actinomycetota bacterium]MTA76357.1 hypothetical protein [Actinomycetota bacterium]